MAGNSFGQVFRISTFGESHGGALGVVIDGCPAGLGISADEIEAELKRRATGQSEITSPRKEEDRVEILSGVFEGMSLGTPIALQVRNKDARPEDYEKLKDIFRPSHADFTYEQKYGRRMWAGGGRASARETTARVMAGALARNLLKQEAGIEISAGVTRVYDIESDGNLNAIRRENTESNLMRCPDPELAKRMQAAVERAKEEGDSLGGVITCVVRNVPVGLGEPVFDKLEADLAKACLSLPATKGFEIGSGFAGTFMKGSEHNDAFISKKDGSIGTLSNHSGGVQGGISNGEDIVIRVAFKPVSTINKTQDTVDREGNAVKMENVKGRHDPCVLPRAVPIVEAMVALVLADHLLRARLARVNGKIARGL
ncbi:MAG: chorismate synthase [Candidatus Magasanikbacteria bacterium]|nr:chorismate synthase [Candidatus Magasanikbacteria bacterium]